jgi:hypothetical protein
VRLVIAEVHDGEAEDVRTLAGNQGHGVVLADQRGDARRRVAPVEPSLDQIARHLGHRPSVLWAGGRSVAAPGCFTRLL